MKGVQNCVFWRHFILKMNKGKTPIHKMFYCTCVLAGRRPRRTSDTARVKLAPEIDKRLDVVKGLNSAAFELLTPAIRHKIRINFPEEAAIVIVNLL